MEKRIAESNITELKANEIFVFGSNTAGNHGGGAAKFAFDMFGAEMGVAVGIQGRCYAIPTVTHTIDQLTICEIRQYVDQFVTVATLVKTHNFLVTEIGCGIAGFTIEQIAPLFFKALDVKNIYLPQSFHDYYDQVAEKIKILDNEH